MHFRISSAAIVASCLLAGSAQAQVAQLQTPQLQALQPQVSQPQLQRVRSLLKMPDPRGEFVRLCAPHMVGRWAHPESVCGCLHDYAAATVEDTDLREALLRGISSVPDAVRGDPGRLRQAPSHRVLAAAGTDYQ